MLYELEAKDYEKVRPMYAAWRPYLAIFAVIDGVCPGRVYVDDREAPRTALLWDHVEGEIYLAGDARDAATCRALNDCLRHQIRPHAEAHLPHLSEYTLFCDTEAWGRMVDIVLAGLNPMAHRRRLYAFEELKVDWRSSFPRGFEMTRMDEALLCREDLEGMDTLHDWVLGDWLSAQDFARREIGFCLIHGDKVVSWCNSEYTSEPIAGTGKACHLGIYTHEEYRRRGLATLVAAATVEGCLEAGIVADIGWHCWASNVGSAATAQKVGFELARDQTVYNGCWNQFDNLLLQAHYHAGAGRMQEAVACWEQGFEMWEARDPQAVNSPHCKAHPGTVAWCYYAAGRARAQRGEADAALGHLNRAVDNGWRDAERLHADEELDSLRGLPGWDKLLSRID